MKRLGMSRREDLDFVDPRFGPEYEPDDHLPDRGRRLAGGASRGAGLARQLILVSRSIAAACGCADRGDLGRGRGDRLLVRRPDPALAFQPATRRARRCPPPPWVVTPYCSTSRTGLLRRDPAFAGHRAGGAGQPLGSASPRLERRRAAAACADQVVERCRQARRRPARSGPCRGSARADRSLRRRAARGSARARQSGVEQAPTSSMEERKGRRMAVGLGARRRRRNAAALRQRGLRAECPSP